MKHFCKNEMYIPDEHLDFPLGFGIFWEVIVPRILEITEHIGCQYLYLFAADHTEQADSKTSRKQRGCLAGILRYLWSLLGRNGVENFWTLFVQRYSIFSKLNSAIKPKLSTSIRMRQLPHILQFNCVNHVYLGALK